MCPGVVRKGPALPSAPEVCVENCPPAGQAAYTPPDRFRTKKQRRRNNKGNKTASCPFRRNGEVAATHHMAGGGPKPVLAGRASVSLPVRTRKVLLAPAGCSLSGPAFSVWPQHLRLLPAAWNQPHGVDFKCCLSYCAPEKVI